MTGLIAAITVLFSPLGGCEARVVKDIAGAKRSVMVQAYALTSQPIIAALVADQQMGIAVHVIVDKAWQTEAPKAVPQLQAAGVDVLIDAKHAIAHSKIVIVDSATVDTGSFNFTWQAEHANAENLVRITGNAVIAKAYVANFAAHAAHSAAPTPPNGGNGEKKTVARQVGQE